MAQASGRWNVHVVIELHQFLKRRHADERRLEMSNLLLFW